jgi:serine/threonine protein kinase
VIPPADDADDADEAPAPWAAEPPQAAKTNAAATSEAGEARDANDTIGERAVRIVAARYRNSRKAARGLDGLPPKCFDPSENVSSPSFATLDIPLPESAPGPLGRAGDYELLLEIAAGGMATVYLGRAVDGRAGAPLVAIKRPHKHLATDKVYLAMLLDEGRLASAIQHDNVVRVREIGFEHGEPFIVMDYVEGASLSELRKELAAAGRAVDCKVAVTILLDALAGLHCAHELRDDTGRHLGIIHRDVSPHNVLVGCDGIGRLTDFGIAKAEDRVQVTRTHEVKGKLAYLAPERIDRRRICSVQSDVFSMAVVFWECIAGRRLFRGEEAIDTLQEVMSAPIPPLRKLGANIPPELDDVIMRGLSRDLETRYLTAKDFAEAIERAAGPANIGSREDVARVIETVFGSRMQARHVKIRSAMGGRDDINHLLTLSGLTARGLDGAEPQIADAAILASIAPPAPSGRYSFAPNESPVLLLRRKPPWVVLGSVSVGLLVGSAAVFVALSHDPPPLVPTPSPAPAPSVVEPSARKVVVPLPFLATRVTFDDESRALDPAVDVAAFEVPREGGFRHRVTATAIDGSRASGFVREQDGVARVESEGFAIELPQIPPGPSQRPGPRPSTAAPGTVKNGFTKLR